MKNTLKRLLSALLTLCMAVSMIGIPTFAATEHVHYAAAAGKDDEETEITAETYLKKYSYSSAQEKLATMEPVFGDADIYGYKLYALELTGEVAVEDTRTGQIIFTNPYDAGKASTSADTLQQLFSQIYVNYVDNNSKKAVLYSYTDSAMLEQIKLNRIKNGIRMDYTIGRSDARRLCPLSINKDRFETVLLDYIKDANDLKKFKSYYALYDPFTEDSEAVKQSWYDTYPITKEMAIYVMAENSTNYEKNKVESIIRAWCPHYTYETLQYDHELTKFVAKSEVMPVFKMALEYKLDEQGLTIRLPANSISFNENYYTLSSLTLLPHFGAGSADYTGYTFVPDGSGTIIRFEDIKDTTYLFTGELYGPDYTYQTLSTSFTGKAELMRLPVFGIVENRGYFYKLDEGGNETNQLYCAHSNKKEGDTVPPTCTEDGYTLFECLSCGEQIKDKIVPAQHTFNEAQNAVVPATCDTQGYTTKTCTVCGETVQTDFVEPAHDFEDVVTPSACEGEGRGYTTHTCKICGYSFVDSYTDPSHDYKAIQKEGVTKAANCGDGTPGVTVYKCSKCEDEYQVTVYADHKYGSPKHIEGRDFKSNGSTYQWFELTCSVCKNKYEIVDHFSTTHFGTDHDWTHSLISSSAQVISEAGCTSYGVTKGECRVCGEKDVTVIKEPSHNFTKEVKEPTCTEGGYTTYTCSGCGYSYVGSYTEPAHDYTGGTVVIEPTCTTNGYTVKTCAVCGHTETGDYMSAAHHWNKGYPDINGKKIFTCLTCFATTDNYAYVDATNKSQKLTENSPVPTEEDFKDVSAPPADVSSDASGDAVSGDAVSGDAVSGDVVSGAASGDAASGAASGDVASGAASDVTSDATGKVDSDLKVPDGAYVKYIQRGHLVIVEEGDSLSTITSSHGGQLHKYNSVYLTVNPRPSDQYNLRDSLSVGEDAPWTVVSKRKYTGSYTMRIVMLGEGTDYDATYSGMANAYRDYLLRNDVLTTVTPDDRGVPLTISTLGWSSKQESFLGIPIMVDQPLTTFEDLKTITNELGEKNITNLNFELNGWTENGDRPDMLEYNKVLGGDKGYQDFVSFAKEKNIGLYPEFAFSYGFNSGLFGGISVSKHAVKTIDDRYIMKREYDPVLQIIARGGENRFGLAMSASAFDYFYSLIIGDLTDLGYLGIAPRDLGSDLNSDFDEDEPYNREDSKAFVIELLAKMKEDSGNKVMVDGGNAYTFPYISYILNAPLEGSNYLRTSASVPFMGMVLHGYINYSGDPTNNASDTRRETLKMIENGAYPFFHLGMQNTQLMVGSNYYSVRYTSWKDDMIEIYNLVNGALKGLQNVEFVEHELLTGERVLTEAEKERDALVAAEALQKAEEAKVAAEAAYYNSVELYNRLIKEEKIKDGTPAYTALFSNIQKKQVAYTKALEEWNTAQATYGERVSDYDEKGNYITTRYTVSDNSIVRVTYANGTSYVLNYNAFDVTVNVSGRTCTIPAFSYVTV